MARLTVVWIQMSHNYVRAVVAGLRKSQKTGYTTLLIAGHDFSSACCPHYL